MQKLPDFPEYSLFLKEREDLLASSLILEPKERDSWTKRKETFEKLATRLAHNQKWTLFSELKNLKVTHLPTWEKIWDHSFSYPISYFYSHSIRKIGEEDRLTRSVSIQDIHSKIKKSINKSNYSWANQYLDLVDFEKLRKELIDEKQKLEEESLFSELTKLDLIKESEQFDQKFIDASPELKKLKEGPKSTPQVIVEWEPPTLRDLIPEFKMPLPNCLPSMFLSYVNSKDFSRVTTEPLKAPPKWVKKLSSLGSRWSIARFIPEERTKALFSPPDLKFLTKQNVQWQDPEEKWFYYYLPLITLFFDKFRERYKKSLITTWEEPEYTFQITAIDLTESFLDLSKAKNKPTFLYEGIPSMKIGVELKQMEALMDTYLDHYQKQVKKEFAEEGLAPIEFSHHMSSTELLQELEKENNIV